MVNPAWSNFEDRVIVDHYPDGGADLCDSFLEGRTLHAIRRRAHLLGVKRKVDETWARPLHEKAIDAAFMAWAMPNVGNIVPGLGTRCVS